MKRILICLIILSLLFVTGKFFYKHLYKEYIPIILLEDKLVEAPHLLSKKHVKNVIYVLKYNSEKWKIENGKLYILRKIDNELLWNYTTKANDSIWLTEHLLEIKSDDR